MLLNFLELSIFPSQEKENNYLFEIREKKRKLF